MPEKLVEKLPDPFQIIQQILDKKNTIDENTQETDITRLKLNLKTNKQIEQLELIGNENQKETQLKYKQT